MLKEKEKTFQYFQQILDSVVVLAAWYISYFLRFETTFIPGAQQGLLFLFLKISPILVVLNLYFFHKVGLYNSQRFNSRYKEIFAVLQANFYSFLSFVIVLYFFSQDKISRIALLNFLIIASILLVIVRMSVRNFLRHLRSQGKNLRHLILVGNGPQILNFIENTKKYKDCGINFIGWMDAQSSSNKYNIKMLNEDLETLKKKHNPDGIVIGYRQEDFSKAKKMLETNYNDLIPLYIIPEINFSYLGLQISDFVGLPILSLNQPNFSSWNLFLKRLMDFLGALIGLIILSPMLLIIAIGVKLTSRGPILYGQERMGLDGNNFKMWKFRSMKANAESSTGAVWAVKDDPRRTAFGTFLRETSLDEFPQLWNVLVGNMSLVGPRPERPMFVDEFKDKIPAYMLRHKMKAGMTGWAQVNGWRGNTSLEKRIEFDIEYIKNWSLWLDIKIIAMTFIRGFINKNAY